jgi:hypothetical protein
LPPIASSACSLQRSGADIERGRQRHRANLAAAHFRAQFFGDPRGIGAVPDDLRPDKMMSSVRTVDLTVAVPKAAPTSGIWSRIGTPDREFVCVSLIKPANITVWPLATEISLLTFRCEIVGVNDVLACGTLLISCSISSRTLPLEFTRG